MNKSKHSRSHGKALPWQNPWRILWFVLALCAAVWFTLNMPEGSMSGKRPVTVEQGVQTTQPAEKDVAASDAKRISPDVGSSAEQMTVSKTTKVTKRHKPRSNAEKLLARAGTFSRLFGMVAIGAFAGGIIECRRWYMVLARCMGSLTRIARLPSVVGISLPIAICSNAAANSILASAYAENKIRHSALIAGGMCNSYLAYISHSIRIMYPVIAVIGIPGILYFTVQFTGGLLVILGVLIWNRHHISHIEGQTTRTSASCTDSSRAELDAPLAWGPTLRKSLLRSASLVFRMVCLAVPLVLGMEWLIKNGSLDFWDALVPAQLAKFFPVELFSVVAAQMGGLVQSAAVAANLHAAGIVDNAQILLAMLTASAVGNPLRALRRNLPTALGIFKPSIAFTIVLGMQFSRLFTTLVSIGLLIFYMHSFLY